MTAKKNTERRQHVRAMLCTNAIVRLVEPAKTDADSKQRTSDGRASWKSAREHIQDYLDKTGAPANNIADYFYQFEEKSDPWVSHLADALWRMDEKLERILSILEGHKEADRLNVKKTVDISGSGMSLMLYDEVKKGQTLDITLQISGFPLGRFRALGEVVYAKPCKTGEENLFEVGVKFVDLSEEEREGLIAFTFSQQRKAIRNSKKALSKQ